ncbi:MULTISPECIES: 4'-phosphopantetheinyl transferase family protein [unclassified Acinetobacter]|uniref:4'-phosphopantetheinyl transferase family protein n=1 Tax=unclassified Acinetobacter TaxID=196816 RepID=UPI002934B9F0|nr:MULTISPECIES: 4'-phosphopantetheinyl transferase superfamily protein [unclassified Acinetobacter]WOE31263.1 4'-phosphopantetheinyl transferase superfamily protein [Acinetobacter sp. SAAs470]WOE39459.1 4'-phosphopantetheinyl transferase superfamily protein [Acinetobacter sp. SAAs474]
MQKQPLITLHIYSLAQLLTQLKADFSNLRRFNDYKKDRIYQCRDQHLTEQLDVKISSQDIAYTAYGKPYLAQYPDLAFNHSHSQQHYALAISETLQDIGVDIEDLSRQVRFDALAKHAFHPNELAHWYDRDQDKNYWFKVWTTKEAVLKASGLGIRINLNGLDTQCFAFTDQGQCYHPQIGYFAFQHVYLAHALLTLAWRITTFDPMLQYPDIAVIQH